ncbi:MAG: glycosyl hydrolase [Verrucomicrobiae bacterium]|nr:glycosyl hydrolase [Verrucomicrobiae bacterium]
MKTIQRSKNSDFHPAPDIRFSLKSLRKPDSCFWPGYFWAINDRMEEDLLFKQLRDMRAHDARSVCLHPLPKEFQPELFGSEMTPDYLGGDYFKIIRNVVGECARLGMNYWLYDEGGWPSGTAAGQVYARNPGAYSLRMVSFHESPFAAGDTLIVPKDALCMAVQISGEWKTFLPGQTIPSQKEDAKLRTYSIRRKKYLYGAEERRSTPYVNLLCRKAVDDFIELTHERHRKHVGNAFGKTIRFAFLDESAMIYNIPGQLPWTDDMTGVFRRMKGYDMIPHLPVLLDAPKDDDGADERRWRIDFYDVCSRLFVERYLTPIRNWCRKNGLLSGGHFGGEDEPRYNADGGFGHILRSLRALDLPGVDAIWRQLFPGKRSHHFVKYASSVARQMGRPYVLTESCAVYGSGLTLAQMKWMIDQQYVRGATMTVFSNYPYSTRDHFMPCCRPHFGPFHPQWRHIAPLHAYAARLGYLLSRGKPSCSTAVYFDVRSIWAGGKARKRAIELHDRLAEELLRNQRDFDFVDDDLLCGKGSRIEKGVLKVGPMQYDTIFVPATDWMDEKALDGLVEFVRSGGTLVTVEGLPRANGGTKGLPGQLLKKSPSGAGKSGRVLQARMNEAAFSVEPVVRLSPACHDIRVSKRMENGLSIYFLTNEANRLMRHRVTFDENTEASLCDPVTGGLWRLEGEKTSEGTALDLELAPWGSKVVIFGLKTETPLKELISTETMALERGWKLRPIRRYSVGEHNYEMKETGKAVFAACQLGDWRGVLGKSFSGDVEYKLEFDLPASKAARPARLCLGKVNHACRVTVNGVEAGRLIWEPFCVDVGKFLRPGRNTLTIQVTNTFANALLDPEVEKAWAQKKGPGWDVPYDAKTRVFEKESLPSGLFGPVEIRVG